MSSYYFSGLTLGKVSKLYPQSNMVDIMLFDGSVLKKVQVMTPNASSRAGLVNLPIPKYETEMGKRFSPLGEAKIAESDVIAVVGFLGDSNLNPVVLGFLFPELNEILCDTEDQKGNQDGTQFLWKHESNVYVRVAKGDKRYNDDGGSDPITPDIEISHPSGLYLKIGRNAGTGYPNYTNVLEPIVNWDKNVRPFKKVNPDTGKADPAPYIHLYHPSGTYLTIDTEGSMSAYIVKDVGVTVEGNVTELIKGDVGRTIQGNVNEVIQGTYDQNVKQKVTTLWEADFDGTVKGDAITSIEGDSTESVDGNLTESVDGNLNKTITGAAIEAYQSSLGKTVSGTETDSVTGAWNRSSSASIDDAAPSVTHN